MENIKIYTDGACSGNPGKGGWAYAIIKNGKVSHSVHGSSNYTTNNQMELTAIIEALKYINSSNINTQATISVHTDSAYCLNSMTNWVHGWVKKGWKKSDGKKIENLDLIKELYKLCFKSNLSVEWVKVKAHQKINSKYYDEFNDYVDKLATKFT
jgi:ribonuclease HI